MRSRSLVAPLVAAIVVVGLTAACGKEPHRMAALAGSALAWSCARRAASCP